MHVDFRLEGILELFLTWNSHATKRGSLPFLVLLNALQKEAQVHQRRTQ